MKVIVLLANGFEEVEALTPVDVLRRAGAEVRTLSIHKEEKVTGAHAVTVMADGVFTGEEEADAVVLPGGLPGATNLAADERVQKMIRSQLQKDKTVGAICAAPLALDAAGVLAGRRFTAYPGVEADIREGTHVNDGIVTDGPLITGKGPDFAMDFALMITEQLFGREKRDEVAEGLLKK